MHVFCHFPHISSINIFPYSCIPLKVFFFLHHAALYDHKHSFVNIRVCACFYGKHKINLQNLSRRFTTMGPSLYIGMKYLLCNGRKVTRWLYYLDGGFVLNSCTFGNGNRRMAYWERQNPFKCSPIFLCIIIFSN